MGTSIKTVVYSCTALASLADNTLTNITAPAIYLPESSKTFRSVWLEVTADDIITATGGTIGTYRVDFGLDAVAQTTYSNANGITHSSENMSFRHEIDVTSYFTTNWTGTSMAANVDVLIDQTTGTTLGQVNVCVSIHITYEYDDTSATQVKTVWLPLDAPVADLAASKPGSATATIPALDTHLPEASKTYRQIAIWRMCNTHGTGTDPTVSMEIESDGASTCAGYESALQSSRWVRYIDTAVTSGIDTSVTQAFYIWASEATRIHHPQVMMQVTYEFDASAANDVFVSLRLPMKIGTPVYGSSYPNAGSIDLFIPESGVSSKEIAFFVNWIANASLTTISLRIGTGSYVSYTDSGLFYAGDNCAMVRNDSAYTLAQGLNQLEAYVYYSSAAYQQEFFSGFWVCNYTCDKPSGGHGAVNTTVETRKAIDTAAATAALEFSGALVAFPQTSWFFAAPFGAKLGMFSSTTGTMTGAAIVANWGDGFVNLLDCNQPDHDAEVGATQIYDHAPSRYLLRWAGDTGYYAGSTQAREDRKDAEASVIGRARSLSTVALFSVGFFFTLHSQTFAVAGTVYGSGGGTVNLALCLATTGEVLRTTTRAGNGAFSFTWYMPAPEVYVVAYESDTYRGRSLNGAAGTDTFDIVLGTPRLAVA